MEAHADNVSACEAGAGGLSFMSSRLAWATEWDYLKTKSKNTRGLQCSSEAECVPSMGKALGSCPRTVEKKTT